MYTIYQINADELDIRFLESLKVMFKHKIIEIAVSEIGQSGEAETEYLLKSPANRRRLMDAIANIEQSQTPNDGLVYVSLDDLEKYS